MNDRGTLEAYALLTATTLCWGLNAVFSRLAVDEVSPMMVVLGRWIGVMILCLVFLRPVLVREWPVLKQHLPFLAAMGAIGFTGFNAFFYIAAHSTTALNIGILQGSIPVFVLLGAWIAYRKPIVPVQVIGVLITMIGVVFIGSQGSLERLASLAFNKGDLYMLVACFFYATYTVGLQKRPQVSPLSIFGVMAVAAFIVSIPLAGAEAAYGTFQWPTMKGWIVIAMITLLPSFAAQIFFIQGVDRIGAGRAGIFVNLVPIFASGFAVLILGERFETYHATALVLVLFGIFLSEKFKPKA